jgi:hypothetical protein
MEAEDKVSVNEDPVYVICTVCGKRRILGVNAIGGVQHAIVCDKCGKVKRKKNGHVKKIGGKKV